MSDRQPNATEQVTIAPGAVVFYHGANGDYKADTVRSIDEERELIKVRGVPGVLRIEDVGAVGVYGDEAEFVLDSEGTGGDRITRSIGPGTEQ